MSLLDEFFADVADSSDTAPSVSSTTTNASSASVSGAGAFPTGSRIFNHPTTTTTTSMGGAALVLGSSSLLQHPPPPTPTSALSSSSANSMIFHPQLHQGHSQLSMMLDDDGASTTTDEASSSGAPLHLNSLNQNSQNRFHQDHDALSTTSSMSTFSSGSHSHFVPDITAASSSATGTTTPSISNLHVLSLKNTIPTIPPPITSFSALLQDATFNRHMFKIKEFTKTEGKILKTGASLQEDEEYPYILASNSYILSIDQEIDSLFIQLKGFYAEKFKDLENNVTDPVNYVQTVLRIGNGVPLVAPRGTSSTFSDIDLSDLLPPSTIMILKVTAANEGTFTVSLSEDKWKKIEQLCRDILQLDESKENILDYVSMRMAYVAPNLSALVGTRIAAQLIGAAGGILSLSQTSADVLQCLGRDKKKLEGLSSNTFMSMLPKRKANLVGDSQDLPTQLISYNASDFSHMRHTGFVGLCDLVMEHTPPREKLRKKVSRVVATKCALAARIDSCNSAKDGSEGHKLREDVLAFIKKLMEPPKRKEDKPLPAPDAIKKTNRGGKKSAIEKELSRTSELRKKYERLEFGTEGTDDSYIGDGSGTMLMKEGAKGLGQSLRLKSAILSAGKKYESRNRKKQTSKTPLGTSSSAAGASVSESAAYFDGISTLSSTSIFKSGTATQIIRTGTATSMAINDKNEMELLNPSLIEEEKKKHEKKKTSYFSAETKFKKMDTSMAPPTVAKKK
ncbi:hypothetical protein C9374_001848 [Naegleria lovaniensis]|uniref:Nop domain-containing protein n=1 Tax=Naegleria lovaniensis TaxID=51637 RepID=A0AA88KLM5_NAELO|nr:uncharacterized protein C9374_001848 [Naegleria lovaniensis]KAG2386813.1 hypothetical protein C9374_001848 [Naegleria lovaniensis]